MASTMSIARALTQRLHYPRQPRIKPDQISLPVELINSTNVAAYDAPDISVLRQHGFRPDPVDTIVASAAGVKRANTTASRINSTPIVSRPLSDELPRTPSSDDIPNLTDASSIESPSPRSERNTLDGYFPESTQEEPSPVASIQEKPSPAASIQEEPFYLASITEETVTEEKPLPVLPQRAPSHSKREHVRLARKRSMCLSCAASLAPQEPASTPEPVLEEEEHPFSPELEQIESVVSCYSGVAEEIQAEEDLAYIIRRGLGYFDGADYAAEIASLEESYLQM